MPLLAKMGPLVSGSLAPYYITLNVLYRYITMPTNTCTLNGHQNPQLKSRYHQPPLKNIKQKPPGLIAPGSLSTSGASQEEKKVLMWPNKEKIHREPTRLELPQKRPRHAPPGPEFAGWCSSCMLSAIYLGKPANSLHPQTMASLLAGLCGWDTAEYPCDRDPPLNTSSPLRNSLQ